MLEISHIYVEIEGKEVIKDLSLTIPKGECHAIMGPNGAGKSTLAKVLAGDPSYEVTGGKILFRGEDLLALEVEERAALGLLMSFQYPIEIAGVSKRPIPPCKKIEKREFSPKKNLNSLPWKKLKRWEWTSPFFTVM